MAKMSKNRAFLVLGLESNASFKDIRERYLSLLKQFHPDNNNAFRVDPKLYEIKEAYEVLKEEKDRKVKVNKDLTKTRVYGKSSGSYSFYETKRENNIRLKKDQLRKEERKKKLEKLIEESNKKREKEQREKRREESINRAFKSIKSILAAKIIEDYLDNENR